MRAASFVVIGAVGFAFQTEAAMVRRESCAMPSNKGVQALQLAKPEPDAFPGHGHSCPCAACRGKAERTKGTV